MDAPIKLLVVEGDPTLHREIVASLGAERDIRLVGGVSSAEEGFQWAAEVAFDVALVGTNLPDARGLAFAAELRRRRPTLAIVVVTASESDDELLAAMRAGTAAYVHKDVGASSLLAIIRQAAVGAYPINEQVLGRPVVAMRFFDKYRSRPTVPDSVPRVAPLTGREIEVLVRIGEGRTNAEIGETLGISPQTVKNHVTAILRKMAVANRSQAVFEAIRRGIIRTNARSSSST